MAVARLFTKGEEACAETLCGLGLSPVIAVSGQETNLEPPMIFRALLILMVAVTLSPSPALAQSPAKEAPRAVVPSAELTELLAALGLDDLLPILRTEGMSYAEGLEAEMFPGRGNARWQAAVGQIYSTDRMARIMNAELAERLPPETIAPLLTFFTSEIGQRIVDLEISAREAMLDDAIDAASRERLSELKADEDPRLDMIERFVDANDLIEMNVAGALNSNLAFYRGLMEGDAFDGALTEAEMLADVWSQAEDIRSDTSEWLFAYLSMAYQPLADGELDDYIALSERPEGVALNAALFAAFDVLFSQISLDLGRGAARMMSGEDI